MAQQSQDNIKVVVDALGGDDAPSVVLDGVKEVVASNDDISIILTGPEDVISPCASQCDAIRKGSVTAHPTTQFIDMGEHPANAVKAKKDSSIVVGCKLVKSGEADAFFSAGSTGACMAAATLYMGRIKGIARPAIGTLIPTPTSQFLLVDAGANADVKPEYLLQFAQMAAIYSKHVLHVDKPRLGLLNIGSEEAKGSELAQQAHALLRDAANAAAADTTNGNAANGNNPLSGFIGNVEGTDLFADKADVVITDGFTGNVVLKTIEGTAMALFGMLKGTLMASVKGKVAGALVSGDLHSIKDKMSAESTGGAPLLGVMGAAIIGHGSSSARAIANGIRVSADVARANVPARIAEALTLTRQ